MFIVQFCKFAPFIMLEMFVIPWFVLLYIVLSYSNSVISVWLKLRLAGNGSFSDSLIYCSKARIHWLEDAVVFSGTDSETISCTSFKLIAANLRFTSDILWKKNLSHTGPLLYNIPLKKGEKWHYHRYEHQWAPFRNLVAILIQSVL